MIMFVLRPTVKSTAVYKLILWVLFYSPLCLHVSPRESVIYDISAFTYKSLIPKQY